MNKLAVALLLALVAVTLPGPTQAEPSPAVSQVRCENGTAAGYPCRNVHLLSHLALSEIGAEDETVTGNDHWGWTDLQTGRDYVLFGMTNGTSFIDVTDRAHPVYLGKLPSHDGVSQWRDIKVYQDVAYIVGDIPTHDGLQLFDLTQLRNVPNPPVTFSETAHYAGFQSGHNLWINQETGYLYAFRTVGDSCNAAMHMVNIQTPLQPTFAGCFDHGEAPLSDAECIVYRGPDADYQGREICFIGSDDNVAIGDVTDKDNTRVIADFTYPGIVRAHQGALTEDQRYWLLSDTMDEVTNGHNTRTYVFDVADLDHPVVMGHYEHSTTARDHNIYIHGQRAYQTNWQAGFRILDTSSLPGLQFRELGYFDIVPESDSVAASGAWSHFTWRRDGAVTVSGTEQGLFVLWPTVEQVFLPVVE